MTTQLNNQPPSGNSILNGNNCKLHFRVEWENFATAKYVIFYVPGYSGHVNRPEFFKLSKCFNANNVVLIAIDMQGHGHSEGERVLLMSHEHLIKDVLQLVESFMDESQFQQLTLSTAPTAFKHAHLPALRKLPFFLMGSSMGGALSMMCAHRLYSTENRLKYPNFKGAIMMAPALSFKTPNWVVVETLRYTMGTCAPGATMPPWMSNVTDNTLTFKDPETLAYTALDAWGNPGGLGWGQGMRYGTAMMFIDFAPVIQQTMSEVTYPFVILHDPADKICGIDGSQRLIEKSATAPEHKKLIEVPGYLHGLLANEAESCAKLALKWMDDLLAAQASADEAANRL